MKLTRFAKYAWLVLFYNLAVILWGAYVRASSSGAGCGSHWPLCNGEVIPRAPEMKTIVEFTHRLTSGLALLMVVGLLIWAFRGYAKKHLVRRGAALSMFFMLTEAGVGAGLVLFELVAENASIARALFMSVHLVNTFFLLSAITLTAWWASGGAAIKLRQQGTVFWAIFVSLILTLILGVSGAVTALGDTLFPVSSLAEGLRQDFSPTAHVLLRLRLLHPILAITAVLCTLSTAGIACLRRSAPWVTRFTIMLTVLCGLQILAGFINVYLLAPIWLQLVHLLLADLVWLSLVLLSANALAEPLWQEKQLLATSTTSAKSEWPSASAAK